MESLAPGLGASWIDGPPQDVAVETLQKAVRGPAAGVRHMAHRFIVGSSPSDALRDLRELWQHGIASSVDLLGEATVTQPEADRYAGRCADAVTATQTTAEMAHTFGICPPFAADYRRLNESAIAHPATGLPAQGRFEPVR